MTRLIASVLSLALLSGCATFITTDEEIVLTGQGVLASYDQSIGEPTDASRLEVSINKNQMRPVELASERLKNIKELADLNGLSVERMERKSRFSSGASSFRIR